MTAQWLRVEVLFVSVGDKWLPRPCCPSQELGSSWRTRPKRGFAAPVRLVHRGQHNRGERGHRQGSYFARARQVLDAHLAQ